MTKQWQAWSERWDALSLRERGLLLLTAVLVPLILIYVLLIEKQWLAAQRIPAQIKSMQQELQHQQRLLDVLNKKQVVSPDDAAREELQSLREELKQQNERIQRAATNLVSPAQMLGMLRSVLAVESGAELLAARSLPVETMALGDDANESSDEADAAEQVQALVFIHPFEVELQGSYQGIYDYLQRLEDLDGVFFWDLLDYNVEEHPSAKVKLKVHTLSSEEGWLGA